MKKSGEVQEACAGVLGVVPTALLLGLFCFFLMGANQAEAEEIRDYLRSLANQLNAERQPPATLAEWEAGREELRQRYMEIIGLDPLPEKTPLNPSLVGAPVDLGDCTFQRVVFESRPKNYVAAHLYVPKDVTFPVPAIVYVPGHGGRDLYTSHPHTYAANGCIAIGLQAAGEEGKRGAGWGNWSNGGHWGPLKGHFNWYNTGYTAIAVEVWDGIRAIDYLLTLEDSGTDMVDETKIGIAGRSGGAARALWTAAADPRIAAAVPAQGFAAVKDYDPAIGANCDVHLFYNYFGLEYAELYSLIAPRALLVQHGTGDGLYPNPQLVADYMEQIYGLYGQPERFEFQVLDQGHGDSTALRTGEYTWLNRWLKGIDEPMASKGSVSATKTCFPGGEPADKVHTEQQFTPATPEWTIDTIDEFTAFKDYLMGHLQEKIIRTAFGEITVLTETVEREDYAEYYVERKTLKLGGGLLTHEGYFFCKPGEARKTVVLLADGAIDKASLTALYFESYLGVDVNLFCIETTGIGGTPWSTGDNYEIDRFAMLTGHTKASLRINDVLAAVKAISAEEGVDPSGVYLWGKGNLAVPVIYAAVVNENVAGVVLEDAPDHHVGLTPVRTTECETALFLILKYGDIPQFAGLLFPRRIILTGEKLEGFAWTKELYSELGIPQEFVECVGGTAEVLEKLNEPPPFASVKVNFQPSAAPVPDGYLVDSGEVFGYRGNGYVYGWNVLTDETLDRDVHADQRYDTLNHMQASGDAVWEIAVPNGSYRVYLVMGDAGAADQINTVDVEGTVLTDPDGEDNFDEYTLVVTVADDRLTVQPAAGASNAKVCFIDIERNRPPVVDAGADQSILLPANTVDLDGTVSDDGLPNGTLTTTWSKSSGPGEVTFGDASAVDTTATFGGSGTYVIGLTASDGEWTGSDTVVVTVSVVSNVQAASGRAYDLDTLADGKLLYIDRAYTWQGVPPEYVGLEYIRTANDDKALTGESFLTFDVGQDVTVYVGYDARAGSVPTWMSDWTKTSDQILTTDQGSYRALYAKDFQAGETVTLGCNMLPDGSMYSVIIRAVWEVPVALASASPISGDAPLAVSFDGTGSSDPDGTIVSYDWDFGDGATGPGETVSHTYTAAGVYTATLTVTDDDGATDTAAVTITVHAPGGVGVSCAPGAEGRAVSLGPAVLVLVLLCVFLRGRAARAPLSRSTST